MLQDSCYRSHYKSIDFLLLTATVGAVQSIKTRDSGVCGTVASQQGGLGFESSLGLFCVGFACSPVSVWFLCGHSGFLLESKHMHLAKVFGDF